MAAELDALAELLLVFPEFGTPSTRPVDFNAVIGGDLSHEARELLHVATQQRETLMDGIASSGTGSVKRNADPRNVSSAVAAYLPSIYKITHSMERSASAQIRLNRPLEFAWTSVLVKAAKRDKLFKCGVLVYEVCFVLTIQALAFYNSARMLLDPSQPDRVGNLVPAARELRKGAGILAFVAESMLPRWVNPPAARPPEVVVSVVAAATELFLCAGQRVSVVQALVKGSPPSVLAKLLLGLSERSSNLAGRVARMDPALREQLFEPLVEEAPLMCVASNALAHYYLGESAAAKSQPGAAVAFLSQAQDSLAAVSYTPTSGPMYRAAVDAAVRQVRAQFVEFRTNNEKVYFDAVPARDRLEVPAGTFIFAAAPFAMPEVDAVSFESTGSGGAGGAAAAAPAVTSPTSPSAAPKRASGSLRSWFGGGGGSKKDVADAAPSGKLQAPPGYDKEVFDSLPEEIQREVIQSYEAEHR